MRQNLLVAMCLAVVAGCGEAEPPLGPLRTPPTPRHTVSSSSELPDPVGWWRGEGDMSDVTGAHHGAPQTGGNIAFTAGKLGDAFLLNGTGGIRVADAPALEPQQITVALWFRHAGTPGLYRYLVAKGINGCSNASYGIYSGHSGALNFYIAPTKGSYALSPTAAINAVWDGEWHHVAGTYDGSVVRMYVDGVQIGNGNPVFGTIAYDMPSTDDFFIGSYGGICTAAVATSFTGGLDEVMVFDRALTPEQIAQLQTPEPPNAPPTAAAGGPYETTEGAALPLQLSASDPDGDALTFEWDLGDGTAGSGSQLPPSHVYGQDGVYLVRIAATDPYGERAEATAEVRVHNVAPTINSFTATAVPVPVGSTVEALGTYGDPGISDAITATIDWGDASTSAAAVGGGAVAASHVYSTPGVYTLRLVVADDLAAAERSFVYVVVYDPAGGFVTGGGWIDSPAGAYSAAPELSGRASFGFVAKYHNGATTPSGRTDFQFHAGNLMFKSSSYQWLVVSGARAQFKGAGTINGAGDYGFLLTTIDGEVTGGGDTDRFRLKIWDRTSGSVVYDSGLGAADDASPATTLAGGSIVIHRQ